ncbi:MAG: lipid II-degrading bacteriocin [Rhodoferax sp.]|nr:lipid II-degrading bacteriocin [Rhodoferax sp.]
MLSASEALAHYLGGTGTALDMDFSEIPTYFVKPTDFPKLNAAINGACFDQKISIDDRTAFASFMKWLTVGNITLRLQGTLIKKCDCSWNFSGHIKSFDDVYDFNESNHRSNVGEKPLSVDYYPEVCNTNTRFKTKTDFYEKFTISICNSFNSFDVWI